MPKFIVTHIIETDEPIKESSNVIRIISNPNLTNSDISISRPMVQAFIKEVQVSTIGTKTTMVRCVLINGFELIETSACVDEANYDENIGADVCMSKITDKIWFLLGFLLQTAVGGDNK